MISEMCQGVLGTDNGTTYLKNNGYAVRRFQLYKTLLKEICRSVRIKRMISHTYYIPAGNLKFYYT